MQVLVSQSDNVNGLFIVVSKYSLIQTDGHV